MADQERIDLSSVDDIYGEKALCMRKEDILTSDPTKYIFAIDSTNNYIVDLTVPIDVKYKCKSIYLDDPAQYDIPYEVIRASSYINGTGTSTVPFGSSTTKTYFKVIVFNSDGKIPVFYEVYHYQNNSFSFDRNSSGSSSSKLSEFNCTMSVSIQNNQISVSCTNSNRVILLKLYDID